MPKVAQSRTELLQIRGEHGQDQEWISCRILPILSDEDICF